MRKINCVLTGADQDTRLNCIIAVDSQTAAELIRSFVEDCGLQIHEAYDGAAALHLARLHPLSLLIVDAGLARIDGLALAAHLRQQGLMNGAKVIALTGGVSESQQHSCVDRFLVKPLRRAALRKVIAELLPMSRVS